MFKSTLQAKSVAFVWRNTATENGRIFCRRLQPGNSNFLTVRFTLADFWLQTFLALVIRPSVYQKQPLQGPYVSRFGKLGVQFTYICHLNFVKLLPCRYVYVHAPQILAQQRCVDQSASLAPPTHRNWTIQTRSDTRNRNPFTSRM